jgi:hypothetical protein
MKKSGPPGPPGCVLFLVQVAPGMTRARLAPVRLHIDQILDQLLRQFAPKRSQARKIDVGIVGYYVDEARKVNFVPLLPGVESPSRLVPLTELAKDSRRQVRLDFPEPAKAARPSDALNQAYLILHHWLARHPGARPPLVLHWGPSRKCENSHARASRSMRLLGSYRGAVGLGHVVLGDDREHFVGEPPKELDPALRRLFRHSSPVSLPKPTRALTVNASPLPLVRPLLKQPRPVQLSAGNPVPIRLRALTVVKDGNAETENEDAYACDAKRGIAAVSDGASEGIFVGPWARLLTQSFLEFQPDPADPGSFSAWLADCRRAWLDEIDVPALRWSQQEKVQNTGGAATFLAWQLGHSRDGSLAWRAWAVGDSCLFWVRRNRLRATFPLTSSRHLGIPPHLLSTLPEMPEPAPLFAAGRCEPGDLFVLATDAVARYLFRQAERGRDMQWDSLELVEEEKWRKWIKLRRKRHKIVNDDCTMIVVRIK